MPRALLESPDFVGIEREDSELPCDQGCKYQYDNNNNKSFRHIVNPSENYGTDYTADEFVDVPIVDLGAAERKINPHSATSSLRR